MNRGLVVAIALLAFGLLLAACEPSMAQSGGPAEDPQVINLRFLSAQEAVKLVKELYGDQDVRIAAETRSNSLILIGSKTGVQKIQAIITKLENAVAIPAVTPNPLAAGGMSRGSGMAPAVVPPVPGAAVSGGMGRMRGTGAAMMPDGMMGGMAPPPRYPEEAMMDKQAYDLALEYRSATGDRKATIRRELTALTTKHFDFRQEVRSTEIQSLSERVDKLRDSLKQRGALKEDIVKKRVNELLDGDRELRWNPEVGYVPDMEAYPVGPAASGRGAGAAPRGK